MAAACFVNMCTCVVCMYVYTCMGVLCELMCLQVNMFVHKCGCVCEFVVCVGTLVFGYANGRVHEQIKYFSQYS